MNARWWRTAVAGVVVTAGALTACKNETTSPPPPPTGPTPPTGLAVQQLTLTSVQVSWNTVTSATGYRLQRADPGAPGVFTVIGGGDLTTTSYTDNGLTQGVTYSYRVATVEGTTVSDYTAAVNVATGVSAATINSNVTANRTLYADTVYTLSGFVKVTNGATLTIQPGTKIVGDLNTPGSSLWILRGAKIDAQGTATNPIVFTSANPVGSRKPGDWGGIIIIGNGVINRTGGPILTEGAAAGIAEDYSGGTDNSDGSGTLKYVRVEFAGYDISNGAGQELNSISSYATGSGTHLEYVEALAGLDDSFEWWGGAPQGRYLLSYESGDDHFDWTEGFRGKLQFIVAFQSVRLNPAPGTGTFSSDPRGFEADGCDPGVSGCVLTATSASTPYSLPVIANFTLVGPGNLGGFPNENGIVLRRGTGGYLTNGVVTRYKRFGLNIRDAFTDTLLVGSLDSLNITNVVLAENAFNYDTAGGGYALQGAFATDNHREVATAAELFSSLNPAGLDWTPAGAATTGGGNIPVEYGSNFFGGSMENTSYVGAAAPGGPKWWDGWSYYAIN